MVHGGVLSTNADVYVQVVAAEWVLTLVLAWQAIKVRLRCSTLASSAETGVADEQRGGHLDVVLSLRCSILGGAHFRRSVPCSVLDAFAAHCIVTAAARLQPSDFEGDVH